MAVRDGGKSRRRKKIAAEMDFYGFHTSAGRWVIKGMWVNLRTYNGGAHEKIQHKNTTNRAKSCGRRHVFGLVF